MSVSDTGPAPAPSETILVTGASRGIGAATARRLLAGGARVIGSYANTPGALDALMADYGRERVLAVHADLAQPGAATGLWRRARDWAADAGGIDGLVNNAGIMPSTPLAVPEERWQDDWSRVMAVNVQAVADLCRLAVSAFRSDSSRKGARGRIVNVASRAAFRGDTEDCVHYAASKGAVVALTRSLARALAGEGIYAFIIAPGWVKTDMAATAYLPGNEHMLAEIPVGDAAPPAQIANMIAFLMSGQVDHATGATFDINGASYVR